MHILNVLKQLRDDIKIWATNNFNALNAKIDEKTIPIDSELSSTSTNPVQNKAIKKAIDNIPKFSGSYNDLTDAPNISEDDSGNMVIADESGNIIFKADAEGVHTTAVSINGEAAATEAYVDNAISNIDIPEVDFTGYATETYVDNKVADLVNSAPEALNTLGELAAALENHEDAYDALLETVSSKATHIDLENLKEELSESIVAESEDWKVVDSNGNIIFSVDAEGAHTTNLTLNGETTATEAYVNEAIGNIEFPEADLTGYATEKYVDDAIANIDIPEVNLDGYATEQYVNDAIAAIPEVDLTEHYTKSETDSAINATKEEISKSIVAESNEWKIVDEADNIIFSVDADGAHTTALSLNGESVEDIIDEKVASLVDSALSTTSTNPVQNKIVTEALNGKAASIHEHNVDDITSGILPVARGGTGNASVDTTPTSGSTKMVTSGGVYTALSGKANATHNQAASTITAGTFAGAVIAQTSSQTPATSLLRNSKLVTTATNPGYNGEICWTYG